MYLDTFQTVSFREQVGNYVAALVGGPTWVEKRNLETRIAQIDSTTELDSRAVFDIARPIAEREADIVFIVFDCNNFKKVNDRISHSAGDDVLREIAGKIKLAVKANSARAFRFGGDEFVVLCRADRAVYLRNKIEEKVGVIDCAGGVAFGDFTVSISGTIGATFDEADELLQRRKLARKAADA